MRIVRWGNNARGEPDQLEALCADIDGANNWTTVLTGENGTKKSLLLRLLLEGTLGHRSFRLGNNKSVIPTVEPSPESQQKHAVIAIAGTPFDRFPRKTIYQRSSRVTRYENTARYTYLGLKAANGTMGAAHSMRTLAYLVLRAMSNKRPVSKPIRDVMDFLELRYAMTISIRRHTSLNVSQKESKDDDEVSAGDFSPIKARKVLDNLHAGTNESRIHGGLIAKLAGTAAAIERLIPRLSRLPQDVVISFEENTPAHTSQNQEFNIHELLALMSAGLIVGSNMRVGKPGAATTEDLVADVDLSSGQWHIFFTMLGLALSVEDESLILIDEPENSLHPGWQRQYVHLLSTVLANRKGCHVVIATHSPLIASGIQEGSGNVVRLVKNRLGPLGVQTRPESLTYGWDAGDVYHELFRMRSTRAVSFVEMADEALAIVRDGTKDVRQLKQIASELGQVAESLPEHDPMRTIVNAIERAASDGERAKK